MPRDKPRVLLIGGLPRPSGGVTVFLGRLVNQIGDEIDFHVLDIHSGDKEPTLAKTLKIAPRHRWIKQLWLVWQICVFQGDIVHFNYSGCHALVALALLPKFGRKFFLTLHNGSQIAIYRKLGRISKKLVLTGGGKIDCAFSLCEDHLEFYRLIKVDEERIARTKSQIAVPDVAPALVDSRHAKLRDNYQHVVVSSGHVSRTYNYEYVIQFVNEHPGCAGLFFFYGAHIDRTYLMELRQKMTDPERFVIYFDQTEAVFLAALAMSDAYLRPTHVDSWGIAVADAISLGVPAVASDVCERAPGATICSSTDFEGFSRLVESDLLNGRVTKTDFLSNPSASPCHLEKYFNN